MTTSTSTIASPMKLRIHPKTIEEMTLVDATVPLSFGASGMSYPNILISTGVRGAGKRRNEAGHDGTPGVHLFNQDAAIDAVIPTPDGTTVRLLAILDGHGIGGEYVSGGCAGVLYRGFVEHSMDLIDAVRHKDIERVCAFWERRFAEMEALDVYAGGSTCTAACVMTVDDRVVITSANVGDSPAGIIDGATGAWRSVYTDHAWDNPEEYAAYRTRCMAKGVMPAEAIYNRFNTSNGVRRPDADGGYEPIRLYEPMDPSDPGRVVIDRRNAAHVARIMRIHPTNIGGTQSVRKMMIQQQSSEGRWIPYDVMPSFAIQNWGSTILIDGQGSIQMTRSLKDVTMKRHLSAIPDIGIYELEDGQDVTLFIGSDGATDIFYFHEIGAIVKEMDHATGQQMADALFASAMDIARSGKHKAFGTTLHGAPAWDDVSIVCCHIHPRA